MSKIKKRKLVETVQDNRTSRQRRDDEYEWAVRSVKYGWSGWWNRV